MRNFLGKYIIQIPFSNVVADATTLELKPELYEWIKETSTELDAGAFCMHQYVEFWFNDKREALKFKLVWG